MALPLVLALTGVSLVAQAIALGWRSRHLWGTVSGPVQRIGDGAFREVQLRERRPRRMPRLVWVAGVSSALGSALTGLAFAPLGLLGALLSVRGTASSAAFAGYLLVLALGGFALSVGLHWASRLVLGSIRGARPSVERVAWWSAAHHAAAPLLLVLAPSGPPPGLVVIVAALSVTGILQAALLASAAHRIEHIHRAMTPEERELLPLHAT
ncbi:MAG: hypothetical protein ACFCGT_16515 [Sandaracinaceae bacterium]